MEKKILTLTIDVLMTLEEAQKLQTMYSQQLEAITLISDRSELTTLDVEYSEIEGIKQ
ncbi:hypothetical protein [Bacillus sp. RS11]|uniref:hypothetical protein n=1 Tax=Lysinibacillus sp. RS11 TaxID=3242682 RepID=UPI0035C707BD